jgi:hypothetical protein
MEEPDRVSEQPFVETAEIDLAEELVVRRVERDNVFQVERRDVVLPRRAFGFRDSKIDGESVPGVQRARRLVMKLFVDSQKSHGQSEWAGRTFVRADWCTDEAEFALKMQTAHVGQRDLLWMEVMWETGLEDDHAHDDFCGSHEQV